MRIQRTKEEKPTLYLVPTPIGNFLDMTYRSIETLKSVDIIFCEDTRVTKVLLSHFDISTPLSSYHIFNEDSKSDEIVAILQSGKKIALVSDAGLPGISDPGFYLAREAVAAGITVQCLPGATAFVPALVSSGLPCDRFCFEGFLPQKKGRATKLESLQKETRTMIFYESPYRVVKTLKQFSEYFGGERQVSACREISKIHEESVRGTLDEVIAHFEEIPPKGEFVIVLAGAASDKVKENDAGKTEKAKGKSKKHRNYADIVDVE